MPRFTPLKARNRGSIANSGSRKHLIFPNSGILTKFQCGVTKGPTRNYSRGGIVVALSHVQVEEKIASFHNG
jgi:hypothetical protein